MKKLIIIAILAAIVAPAMGTQIIPPGPAPVGVIPVMMTIDRFAEMLLPDTIILEPVNDFDLTGDWSNPGGEQLIIRANFNCEIQVHIVPIPAFVGIGTWDIGLVGGAFVAVVDAGDYATMTLDPTDPTQWEYMDLNVTLTDVDLTGQPYNPAAVPVANVNITVVSQ